MPMGGGLTLSKFFAALLTTTTGFTADKDYKQVIMIANAASDTFYQYFTVNGTANTYDESLRGSADIGSSNVNIGSVTVSNCGALIYNNIKSGDAFKVSSGSFSTIFLCFE